MSLAHQELILAVCLRDRHGAPRLAMATRVVIQPRIIPLYL